VQHTLDSARADGPSIKTSFRSTPTLGMRGGLGKTLLIAFLLLAIIPLALLAFLTYNQIQRDTSRKLVASLETMVALKEAHLVDWVESHERELGLLADALAVDADPAARLVQLRPSDSTIADLILVDRASGKLIASTVPGGLEPEVLERLTINEQRLMIEPASEAGGQPLLAISHDGQDRRLIGLFPWDSLEQIIAGPDNPTNGVGTYLITDDALMISAEELGQLSPSEQLAISQAMNRQNRAGAYTNLHGTPVFGAYHRSPELEMTLLMEQSQTQALKTGNTLTAVVVAATLAVALITAAIAAVVTRRITRPIVQLTETAAWMARGDLNQRVAVARRDEIGVLARAFNRMAADLRVLYENLESKVEERTQQLREANERIHHHAMQLALSAEVARVISSIREMEELLTTVAQLIGNAFELQHVSIYLFDDSGDWLEWQAGSDASHPQTERQKVGSASLVGQVASDGRQRVIRASEPHTAEGPDPDQIPLPFATCEMAIPLRIRDQWLGVLDLRSTRHDAFDEDDQMVYESLADQISVAIENARAYTVERETVRKLKELDRIQAQFLTHMSHALRTPLTSIIGFSQVMLRELDGPLTDAQRTDLITILESGRQLLGLLKDMLELTQLELGTAPFAPGEVDLAEIIEGVMATARALARDKPVVLHEDMPQDLPTLYTDGQRVRQVILALLSNAVKFTEEGTICLRVTPHDDHVTISVSDTGVVLSQAEQARLFSDAPYADDGQGNLHGFGPAISKRAVERLGGQVWIRSEEGIGSTLTFTLPLRLVEGESIYGAMRNVEQA